MRKIIELAQEFPTIFGGMNETEIAQHVWDLQTSGEYEYVRRDGIGTFDINDNVEIEKGEYYDSCEGKTSLELHPHNAKNYNLITIYLNITLWDFHEDEGVYYYESHEMIGWELNF